jgi:hypothetical protein
MIPGGWGMLDIRLTALFGPKQLLPPLQGGFGLRDGFPRAVALGCAIPARRAGLARALFPADFGCRGLDQERRKT